MKRPRAAGVKERPSRTGADPRFSTASASFSKLVQLAGNSEEREDRPVPDEPSGKHGQRRMETTELSGEPDGEADESKAHQLDDEESMSADGEADEQQEDAGEAEDEVGESGGTTESESATRAPSAASTSAPLSSSSLASFSAEMAATGLLYFSRLPPHMKPHKLRQLLAQYGHILRVYLSPEHSSLTARRRTAATSAASVKRYTDGWVEFADKRVAKAVAVTLNGTTMGGRKRGYWYDDVWSCKYLKGFKWQHLTERGVMEGKGREGRRREEVGRAKREAEHYRQQMDKRKKVDAIRTRKEKQRTTEAEGGASTGAGESDDRPILRTFHQRPAFPGKVLEE